MRSHCLQPVSFRRDSQATSACIREDRASRQYVTAVARRWTKSMQPSRRWPSVARLIECHRTAGTAVCDGDGGTRGCRDHSTRLVKRSDWSRVMTSYMLFAALSTLIYVGVALAETAIASFGDAH